MTGRFPNIALAAFAGLACALPAAAQDEPVINMQDIDCRTMLKMGGDEQAYTLLYFHGYVSGTKADMVFNGPAFREATDKIMDFCIDNPSAALMEGFEKNR